MLSLLRKYQKIMFICVGVFVFIPFVFSGVFAKLNMKSSGRSLLGKAVDGSKVYQDEIERLVAFLSIDVQESLVLEGPGRQNFFNDGVLKKDIFDTGISDILVETYQDQIKKDLSDKFNSFAHYKSYEHPQTSFLNAERVWSQFCPDLVVAIQKFKKATKFEEQFQLAKDIYLAQREFPPALLRQFLYFQERQLNLSYQDPYIQRGDLAVFHSRNPYDFFGYQFLNLCAQFIHNTALVAKSKGFKVSPQEAKADLLENIRNVVKTQVKDSHEIPQTVQKVYQETLSQFKFQESDMIHIWQEVLLFRRLLADVSKIAVADSLTSDQFAKFALEKIKLDLYEMPQELQVSSFDEMMKLETYLTAVDAEKGTHLGFPKKLKSIEELKKSVPDFFFKKFKIRYLEVNREDLKKSISLKQVLSFITDENNFKGFSTRQPKLSLVKTASLEEKLNAFDRLEQREKAELIQFTQEQILKTQVDWLETALSREYGQEIEVKIPLIGTTHLFKGFENASELLETFEKASSPIVLDRGGKYLYKIEVVSASHDIQVMEFKEADDLGVLDHVLIKKLEPFYKKIQSKYPELFEETPGSFFPIQNVMDKVGAIYFKESLDHLKAELVKREIIKPDVQDLDLIAKKRYLLTLESALKKREPNFSVEPVNHPLAKQFELKKRETIFEKKQGLFPQFAPQIVRMKNEEWSPVVEDEVGQLVFFQIKDKEIDHEKRAQLQLDSQKLLANDAVRYLAFELATDFQLHQVIHLENDEAK